MFIHETRSYFIMISLREPANTPADYLEKKLAYIVDGVKATGGTRVGNLRFTWMLDEVMFPTSADVYKILVKEINNIVAADSSLSAEEKAVYTVADHSEFDKIIVTEYVQGTTYIP